MSATLISQAAAEAEIVATKALGFHFAKTETLFFRWVIDTTKAHGIKPPKERDMPAGVRRVVNYDHVKL